MLKKEGFILIKKFFDPKKILLEATNAINEAQQIKWRYAKIYHNIYINNFINFFSIRYPGHKSLNNNLNKHLAELNLQNLVLNHTEWKNFKITQIELQHNEKYNYQSTWHRDWHNSNLENIVMIIYLTDQKGFRLVKRAEDLKLALNYPDLKEKNYKFGYTNLPKDYFYEFDVKAGDIVLFDAGLLHQGFVKGKRTHFFIRCKEIKSEISKNFNEIIEDHLQVDSPIEVLEQDAKKDSYNYDINYFSLNSRIKSLIHLVLYFFPIHKIFKYLKDRKKKFIHFHYSYFQK